MSSFIRNALTIALIAPVAVQAQAISPRDTLIRAAFATPDKAQALGLVNQAIAEAGATLVQTPADHEAQLQHALGIGYRGQLTRSPSGRRPRRHPARSIG